jgi:hypothetical protein
MGLNPETGTGIERGRRGRIKGRELFLAERTNWMSQNSPTIEADHTTDDDYCDYYFVKEWDGLDPLSCAI